MKLGLGRRGLSFGGSGGPPKPVTDFFNGFDLSGSTYSGGPTVVADNTGALVTSPAGVLPLEGMRLATTVADGAELGPELIPQPLNLASWVSQGVVTETTATSFTTSGAGGEALISLLTIGKKYQVSSSGATTTGGAEIRQYSPNPHIKIGDLNTTFEFTATDINFYIRNAGSGTTTVPTISVREVIPTWLPTTSLGAQIHSSTPLRTRKGTVSVYDESFKGPLVQPARTNLFLNSTAPVTQNITTTAQAYTVTVLGTGSITLSGTATGTATQGSPLTVTASAGTLTCTVTGTLTRVNVEAGAFGTSFIDTAATTVTRPAANLTRPTAGTALETGNNFAIYGRVVPKAAGQDAYIASLYIDASNWFAVYATDSGTNLRLGKVVAGAAQIVNASGGYTHAANTPFEYLAYQHSIHGMGIAVRSWNGSAWSAWSAWATNANTQNAPIASTYQIGARADANHFAANYPFTKIIALNPALNPQSQLADWLSRNRI